MGALVGFVGAGPMALLHFLCGISRVSPGWTVCFEGWRLLLRAGVCLDFKVCVRVRVRGFVVPMEVDTSSRAPVRDCLSLFVFVCACVLFYSSFFFCMGCL